MTTVTEPRTFTDTNGKTWDVKLTLAAARRVDNSDFTEITQDEFSMLNPSRELFTDILTNTSLLFAIVFAIVRPQVKANLGIDLDEEGLSADDQLARYVRAEEAFVAALDGPAISSGREAVWGSVVDFFPEHKTALSTLKNQLTKAQERIEAEVKKLEPEMEAMIEREIQVGMEEARKELNPSA